jgi:hypothetical protein
LGRLATQLAIQDNFGGRQVQRGSATITATQGGISGSTIVMVTPATLTAITITPPTPSIAKGTTVQFTATGTFTDGSTQDLTHSVSWTAISLFQCKMSLKEESVSNTR